MIYYIADTHFGHKNVLRHDQRPFSDTGEMAEAIIRNWNRKVKHGDTVYMLGDAFWKSNADSAEIMKRLNGHKHLILGNHDKISGSLSAMWESVDNYAEITDGNTLVILCHYPILFYRNQHHGAVMLYGHVHNSAEWGFIEKWRHELREAGIPDKIINVGCMMAYMHYTPRTLSELLESDEKTIRESQSGLKVRRDGNEHRDKN